MTMNKKIVVASLLGLIALAVYPQLVTNAYYVHLAETILIYAILLFGLDIVVGYTGQVSLGHAGLFGVGSYVTGVLVMKLGLSWYLTIPASIAGAALFGAVLALPALRVTGPYLAMVTLAFGTIVQILINEMGFLTEGPMGITLTKPSMFGKELDEKWYFYMVAVLMVVSLAVVHRLLKSNIGRAFEALRDSPIASDCMGVSVYRYKVYAFVISAGLAGLAGSLYAYSEQYISPNTYNFELTILFLLAVIMGGAVPQDRHRRGGAGRRRFRPRAGPQTRHGARRAGSAGCDHRDGGRIVPAREHGGLAPDHLRADDAVRRLLPAGRYRRLPAQAGRARPGARHLARGGGQDRPVCRHQGRKRRR
jgi:ABC-type branched-subunit amino acid transport system permease subunit